MDADDKHDQIRIDNPNGTPASRFTAVREATQWTMPQDEAVGDANSSHREDFDRLLRRAVTGAEASERT